MARGSNRPMADAHFAHPLARALRCPDHPSAVLAGESDRAWRCLACGSVYRVRDGIPDFTPAAVTAAFSVEAEQWDDQAERYEAGRVSDPLYMAGVRAAVWAARPIRGRAVLDAGCGTGLVTRALRAEGVAVAAIDASAASLGLVDREPDGHPILAVRGDLTRLPFADESFDRVVCANVLQQFPDPAARRRAVSELARVARPGGRIVVTAHAYSVRKRWLGWPVDGPAGGPSGMVRFVHRFTRKEFADLLATALGGVRLTGAMFPLPYRFKLSWLSRVAEMTLRQFPIAAAFGEMLVGVGARKSGAAPAGGGDPAGRRHAV